MVTRKSKGGLTRSTEIDRFPTTKPLGGTTGTGGRRPTMVEVMRQMKEQQRQKEAAQQQKLQMQRTRNNTRVRGRQQQKQVAQKPKPQRQQPKPSNKSETARLGVPSRGSVSILQRPMVRATDKPIPAMSARHESAQDPRVQQQQRPNFKHQQQHNEQQSMLLPAHAQQHAPLGDDTAVARLCRHLLKVRRHWLVSPSMVPLYP